MAKRHHNAGAPTTWLTPPEILKALGPFDLDPCAAPDPKPWPTAARMVTLPDDGLSVAWAGRVWLNPPYDHHAGVWMARLADHGRGVAMVLARTETEWWRNTVWARAEALLFLYGRPHFHYPDGRRAHGNSGAPVVLVAYGADDAQRLEYAPIAGAFVRLWRP